VTWTLPDGRPVPADAHIEYQDQSRKPLAFVEGRWSELKWSENGRPNQPQTRGYTAAELMETDFPEMSFAVPGILTEGLNLLAGSPKLGKSWMALGIAVAVASGGRALGKVPVDQGEALYLALEDAPRRLKRRLGQMLSGDTAPSHLHLFTEWNRLSEGGAEQIVSWVGEHPSTRLVVVDVYARVRPRVSDRADRYLEDYQSVLPLKALADAHGLAVLCLHHTRKATADDFVETVSGTFGLAGAADTILVAKRSRGQADATLQITGRDVEEHELALRFSPEVGTWSLLGDSSEWAMSETRRELLNALKVSSKALTPKQLSAEVDRPYETIKKTLQRMAADDQVVVADGRYSLSLTKPVPDVPAVLERDTRDTRDTYLWQEDQ
jgi:AAA domain